MARIAAAFRAAGGGGRIKRLPDAAIKASLRRAGLDHDRQSVTFDEPIALGSPPTTGYTNDPVNTATGNVVEIETDLLCDDRIAGLTFQRTYNSRSDRTGPFGRRWSSWATTRLLPRDGAEYVAPDGQEAVFPRMDEGYGRIVGVDALVEPLASGLALNWFGGGRWEFDEAGLPVTVSNGPGTGVSLHHDEQGRLSELAHAGGRHVRLQWDDETERIVGLECSDGRSASYSYDASHDLVGVGGTGGTRRYELDQDGRVVSVRDGDGGVELVNTYDDDGRLLAVVDGNDQRLSLSYDEWGDPVSITERNGAMTVQEWDERARPRRRVLPTGVTFTFAYDAADRLVEITTSTGAVTRYAYSGDERDRPRSSTPRARSRGRPSRTG